MQADAITSDIVGYTTIPIQSKYQIIGVNFQNVSGGSLKLNEAIPYQEGMTKGTNGANADNIQIGNSTGGWTVYFMSNGKNAKGKDVAGLEGKWSLSGTYAAADVDLTPGTAFWYVRSNADESTFNLTIAGSVSTLPSADYEFASQYRIFANPYPTPLAINDAFPYNAATMTAGTNGANADNIQIGNGTGGWTVYFLSNGKNAKGKDVAGLEGKWSLSGSYAVTDATIPVGKAAWYVRKDTTKPAVSITLTRPYSL